LGVVGGEKLRIKTAVADVAWDLAELHTLWHNSIVWAMGDR
jgi:hypothetical protein